MLVVRQAAGRLAGTDRTGQRRGVRHCSAGRPRRCAAPPSRISSRISSRRCSGRSRRSWTSAVRSTSEHAPSGRHGARPSRRVLSPSGAPGRRILLVVQGPRATRRAPSAPSRAASGSSAELSAMTRQHQRRARITPEIVRRMADVRAGDRRRHRRSRGTRRRRRHRVRRVRRPRRPPPCRPALAPARACPDDVWEETHSVHDQRRTSRRPRRPRRSTRSSSPSTCSPSRSSARRRSSSAVSRCTTRRTGRRSTTRTCSWRSGSRRAAPSRIENARAATASCCARAANCWTIASACDGWPGSCRGRRSGSGGASRRSCTTASGRNWRSSGCGSRRLRSQPATAMAHPMFGELRELVEQTIADTRSLDVRDLAPDAVRARPRADTRVAVRTYGAAARHRDQPSTPTRGRAALATTRARSSTCRVRELLMNVVKHAEASSADVRARPADGDLLVSRSRRRRRLRPRGARDTASGCSASASDCGCWAARSTSRCRAGEGTESPSRRRCTHG